MLIRWPLPAVADAGRDRFPPEEVLEERLEGRSAPRAAPDVSTSPSWRTIVPFSSPLRQRPNSFLSV
jgi:hypothetical protein